MPITQYEASVLTAAIGAVPSIVHLVQGLFAQQQPGVPVPSSDQVIAALQEWAVSSLAIDDAWRAAHPVGGVVEPPA